MIVECAWSDRGGWKSFNSHDAGTFAYPLNYGMGSVFPPDNLGFVLVGRNLKTVPVKIFGSGQLHDNNNINLITFGLQFGAVIIVY